MPDNYYESDLAQIHHEDFTQIAAKASTFFLQKLQEYGLHKGLIIDLGCGSGVFLAKLAKAGYQTTGVDWSKPILDIAQQQVPKSTFIQQSIWDYQIPPCHGVAATGEIITYRFDDQNTNENIIALFQQVYHQLIAGGIFLFDYLEPNILGPVSSANKIVNKENWTMVIEFKEDKSNQTFSRDITLFKKIENGLYRKSREFHPVRLLETTFLVTTLQKIGFEVTQLDQYGDLSLRKNHKALLAVKPKHHIK